MTMHQRHKDWIESRGIDPALAERARRSVQRMIDLG
jgi:hypothetical protein